jgi:flagellar protein FlgJ
MDPISAIAPPQGFGSIEAFKAQRSDRAYKSFEAMFLQELLKEMRKTVPEDGFFPKSPAMRQYEEMMDGVIAQSMADSTQLGIAKQLAAEAKRQEDGMALLRQREADRLAGLKPRGVLADKLSSLGGGD